MATMTQKGLSPVTSSQGEELANQLSQLGASQVTYRECSALTRTGLKDVFDTSVSIVLATEEDHETDLGNHEPDKHRRTSGCSLF